MPTRDIPLFPLPLVLFPGVPLPLHIFEPRYRQMLADALKGDRMFGILYRPESTEERDLPRGHVGCVARVEKSEELPDGRANITVTGVERFCLERFVERDAPYHVGAVSEYFDVLEPEAPLAELAARVRAVFERVGQAARALADDSDPLPTLPEDPALLSFGVAALIDLDAPARQRLLASRSPSERLRELATVIGGAVDALEARAVVHRRAKSNGQGLHAAP